MPRNPRHDDDRDEIEPIVDWNGQNRVMNARMTLAKQRAEEYAAHADGQSMLDKMIFDLRVSGASVPAIAEQISLPDHEVARRLKLYYERMEITDVVEIRTLQIARLEAVIASMNPFTEAGSVDHAKIMLDAVERINKMMNLEIETNRVEIQIITDRQADLVISVVQALIESIFDDPEVRKHLDRAKINELAGRAMESAAQVVVEGQAVVMETKELEAMITPEPLKIGGAR